MDLSMNSMANSQKKTVCGKVAKQICSTWDERESTFKL